MPVTCGNLTAYSPATEGAALNCAQIKSNWEAIQGLLTALCDPATASNTDTSVVYDSANVNGFVFNIVDLVNGTTTGTFTVPFSAITIDDTQVGTSNFTGNLSGLTNQQAINTWIDSQTFGAGDTDTSVEYNTATATAFEFNIIDVPTGTTMGVFELPFSSIQLEDNQIAVTGMTGNLLGLTTQEEVNNWIDSQSFGTGTGIDNDWTIAGTALRANFPRVEILSDVNPSLIITDETNGVAFRAISTNVLSLVGTISDHDLIIVRNNAQKIRLTDTDIRFLDYGLGYAMFSANGTISSVASIPVADVSGLSPVAISGDYNDLVNAPPGGTTNDYWEDGNNTDTIRTIGNSIIEGARFIPATATSPTMRVGGADGGVINFYNSNDLTTLNSGQLRHSPDDGLLLTSGDQTTIQSDEVINLDGEVDVKFSTKLTSEETRTLSGATTIQLTLTESQETNRIFLNPTGTLIVLGLEILDGTSQANYDGNWFLIFNNSDTETISFVHNQSSAPIGSRFGGIASGSFTLAPRKTVRVDSNGTLWYASRND